MALLENTACQQREDKQVKGQMERLRVVVPKRRALLALQQQKNQTAGSTRASINELQMKSTELLQQIIIDCS
jgi:hypothetical protein